MTDPHWYAVDKDGQSTLCAGWEDARDTAAESAQAYPQNAPYRAVQMVAVDDLDAMRQRMFQQGWDAGYAARDEE